MLRRIAFYPCCATDILRPLAMLRAYVDEVIFCDINPQLHHKWSELADQVKQQRNLPKPNFVLQDARQVVKEINRIDVLFYRRDSGGESGSNLLVLSSRFLPQVLEKMPSTGGVIITDGSNHGDHLYRKIFRPTGVKKFGWHMRLAPEQPFHEIDSVWVIDVMRL